MGRALLGSVLITHGWYFSHNSRRYRDPSAAAVQDLLAKAPISDQRAGFSNTNQSSFNHRFVRDPQHIGVVRPDLDYFKPKQGQFPLPELFFLLESCPFLSLFLLGSQLISEPIRTRQDRFQRR